MKKILGLAFICGTVLSFPMMAKAEMTLQSPDMQDGGTLSNTQVFNGFGCEGDNISPALTWEGVPVEAESLAITAYDPDAPTGSGWWHWVVFNIPTNTTSIESGASGKSMPEGSVESMTDFGKPGFGGACPPEGDAPHHYIFTVHALDTKKLDLDEKASGAMVGYYLNAHGIDTASMTVTFGRPADIEEKQVDLPAVEDGTVPATQAQ